MTPFPMIEKAVRALLEQRYAESEGKVGGDPSYQDGDDFFVWVALVTGSTTQIDGEWIVDIDVLAKSYGEAMTRSLAIEAAMLGGGFVTSVLRIDFVRQNESPVERPWSDDDVSRVGATYVFTARRSG